MITDQKYSEAIKNKDLNFCKKFYSNFDLNYKDGLFICGAAFDNSVDIFKFLVSKGEDYTIRDQFSLRFASQNGNIDIVRYLLTLPKTDASVDDWSAFRQACDFNHIEIVKLLLEANPNTNLNSYNSYVLFNIAIKNQIDLLKFLLSKGIIINNESLILAIGSKHFDLAEILFNNLKNKNNFKKIYPKEYQLLSEKTKINNF